MKFAQTVCTGFFLLLLVSCSNDNPVSNSTGTWLMVNTSFEVAGMPDITGWIIHADPGDTQVEFSTDVSPVGGKWCVKLESNSKQAASIEMKFVIDPKDAPVDYLFSYSVKGFGTASVYTISHTLVPGYRALAGLSAGFKKDAWQSFVDTVHNKSAAYDSLSVILSSSQLDSTSIAFFDNIRLIAIKK